MHPPLVLELEIGPLASPWLALAIGLLLFRIYLLLLTALWAGPLVILFIGDCPSTASPAGAASSEASFVLEMKKIGLGREVELAKQLFG
jgi:hypothetical protein